MGQCVVVSSDSKNASAAQHSKQESREITFSDENRVMICEELPKESTGSTTIPPETTGAALGNSSTLPQQPPDCVLRQKKQSSEKENSLELEDGKDNSSEAGFTIPWTDSRFMNNVYSNNNNNRNNNYNYNTNSTSNSNQYIHTNHKKSWSPILRVNGGVVKSDDMLPGSGGVNNSSSNNINTDSQALIAQLSMRKRRRPHAVRHNSYNVFTSSQQGLSFSPRNSAGASQYSASLVGNAANGSGSVGAGVNLNTQQSSQQLTSQCSMTSLKTPSIRRSSDVKSPKVIVMSSSSSHSNEFYVIEASIAALSKKALKNSDSVVTAVQQLCDEFLEAKKSAAGLGMEYETATSDVASILFQQNFQELGKVYLDRLLSLKQKSSHESILKNLTLFQKKHM